jgi:hygromycin-B 7''-O-kinase
MSLPNNLDPVYFDKTFRLQPELWKDAVMELCTKHHLPHHDFHAYTDGTNLIASLADLYIVKIFPPFLRHQWDSEYRVLKNLNNKLHIPVPELLAHGETENKWVYVILTKLHGVTMESVWGEISLEDKKRLLFQMGQIMQQVHSLPVDDLHDLPPQWDTFFLEQIQKCKERHIKLNAPDWLTNEIENYVRQNIHLIPKVFTPVILTGEYTPFNILVQKDQEHWNISAMIDFGDAMIGFNEYDLLGPSVFSCEGKIELVAALFDGYGIPYKSVNSDFRTRLMLLMLLHRYSDLNTQIFIPEWSLRVNSLVELEELIWPVS